MTRDALRELLSRQPFDPIRITMSSGQEFEVRHPEMAALGRSSMHVNIPSPDGSPSDRWEYLSYLHIAHVKASTPADQAA
jgi:hypothetical protein